MFRKILIFAASNAILIAQTVTFAQSAGKYVSVNGMKMYYEVSGTGDPFMADDWVIVSERGVTKKADFLAVVASGDLTHETFKGEIISVRQYGDAAVLTGRVRNNGDYKGKPFSSDEWTTDVFIKRNGRWLCVHSHITTAKET